MDNAILWLWLGQRVCLSRAKQTRLIEHFGSIDAIYRASLSDYTELDFLTTEELNLLTKKELDLCYAEMEKLRRLNGGIITIDSPEYPDLLRKISSPPCLLYYRGNLINLNDSLCIAMVGTRKASRYGKDCAFALAKELSGTGVTVVSGLAMGIDAKAHEGAIKGGSPTVAVIGCGVDIAYPLSNAGLMNDIVKSGMVLSEYPLGAHPEKYHFPERNRIISGICHGTLVVEADYKSGSLITSKLAMEQGRDVFAVPGNINSIYSKGTNYLIKDGAHVVTTAEDVLRFYRFDYPELLIGKFPSHRNQEMKEPDVPTLDLPQNMILKVIGEDTLHTDTICQQTGLDIGTVNSSLLMMELTGILIKLPGGFYTKTKSID